MVLPGGEDGIPRVWRRVYLRVVGILPMYPGRCTPLPTMVLPMHPGYTIPPCYTSVLHIPPLMAVRRAVITAWALRRRIPLGGEESEG